MSGTWKRLFTPTILSRGREYYREGLVRNFNIDGNEITATVRGHMNYCVTIFLSSDGTKIDEISCECPYAEGGIACKHMAAVMFEVEDIIKSNKMLSRKEAAVPTQKGAPMPIKKVIDSMTEQEVRAHLLAAAQTDDGLADRLRFAVMKTVTPTTKREWRAQVKRIVSKHANRFGYISTDSVTTVSNFQKDFWTFVDDTCQVLLDNELYPEVFALTVSAYEAVAEADADSVQDLLEFYADGCLEYWTSVAEHTDIGMKRKMFNWLLDTYAGDITTEVSGELMERLFPEREFSEKKMQRIDRMLLEHNYHGEYALTRLAEERCRLMAVLGQGQDEQDAFLGQFNYIRGFRMKRIERAMQKGDYATAIQQLKLSRDIDHKDQQCCRGYTEQLISLYEKTGQRDCLGDELLYYLLEFPQYEKADDYIDKLKAATDSAEWPAVRDKLLAAEHLEYYGYELMRREGMYRELFNIAITREPFLLEHFEETFLEQFPMELREVLLAKADNEMSQAANRIAYGEAVRQLAHIATLPEGAAAAQDMANRWREIYSRRSAMLEELKKVGL